MAKIFFRRYNKRYAFTLIEILAVTSIMAIVGLAIFSTFAAGLKAYNRVKYSSHSGLDAWLTLKGLEKDLRNTFCFNGIEFRGSPKEISFAGLIDKNLHIGRITYYFDANTGNLIKAQQPYSYALLENKPQGVAAKAVAYIKDITFSYYYLNPGTQLNVWKDTWDSADIPKIVKVRLTVRDKDKDLQLEKTVLIPVSG
jgi:hypothetical protein